MNILVRDAAKRLAEAAAGTFLAVIATQCADAVWARISNKAGEEPEKSGMPGQKEVTIKSKGPYVA